MKRLVAIGKVVAVIAVVLAATVVLGARHYQLPPQRFVTETTRDMATRILGAYYSSDMDVVLQKTSGYWHGLPDNANRAMLPTPVPFVYENADEPYLKLLREKYNLDEVVAGASSEYEAILKLGGWVGSQFDHGTDKVVGGHEACDPAALIEAGKRGGKYWCEIAARLMVHSAASVGLPARVFTASRDGYTWEHAIAEVWSNEFGKWFVVDVDFNFVYEHAGVPLSAVELLQQGEALAAAGKLTIRQIAPSKPSIPPGDALYVYRYVHLDMRNDWCSRPLQRGSPAGSDLSTWWYAPEPLASHLVTARKHIPDPQTFNWPLNGLWAVSVSGGSANAYPRMAVVAFSPYFEKFEQDTGAGWEPAAEPLLLTRGTPLRVRAVTSHGWRGPVYEFTGEKLVLSARGPG